jgi:hypothetical protein
MAKPRQVCPFPSLTYGNVWAAPAASEESGRNATSLGRETGLGLGT